MSKIIRMTLEEAMAHPISERQKAAFEKMRNIRDKDIDFSDIPEFTDEELAKFRPAVPRGGARPGAGRKPSNRVPVTLRLNPAIAKRLRAEAKRRKTTLSQVAEERLAGV